MTSTTKSRDRSGPVAHRPLAGVIASTRSERQLAVEHWLMSAASSIEQARAEWETYGVALLRCGTVFTAVRVPAAYVHAAARTEERGEVAVFLAKILDEGPVFFDRRGRQYYVLTPASTAAGWSHGDAECFGRDTYLGIPACRRIEPDPSGDAYWVVPMDSPSVLCARQEVEALVVAGRTAWAKQRKDDGGE